MKQTIRLDDIYDAIGDEFGRGWRIVDRSNPTKTPNLLSGLNPSLAEARERLDRYKKGRFRDRDYKGQITI